MTEISTGGRERSGLHLFRLFGIDVRLDVSVLIIFGLIVYSLGAGLLPEWHPGWTAALRWTTALAAGLIFFASLLAHELSHSLVARRYGIEVPRITLFLFGGVAEMKAEARTPQAEFAIAIAGPLMSLALGVLFAGAASLAIDEALMEALLENPAQGMAALSAPVTAALWLSSVNIMLALFNMLPGFPLDGGRVFRSAVWRFTGDFMLATRLASTAGRWFGWGLMALGLWNLLALRNGGGLWLILIGWFLSYLAGASYSQQVTRSALRELRVRDLMLTRFDTVQADMPLDRFVEDCLLRSRQSLWPVVADGRVVGLVSAREAATVPPSERAGRRVSAVMGAPAGEHVLAEDVPAEEALARLLERRDEPVAVMREGRAVGILRGSDILRWVSLHREERGTGPR